MKDKIMAVMNILSDSIKKDVDILKRLRRAQLISIVCLAFNIGGMAVGTIFYLKIIQGVIAFLLLITIYKIGEQREAILSSRIQFFAFLLKETCRFGQSTTKVLFEEMQRVSQKYQEKKSRLEDLIGPDFEGEGEHDKI